MGARKGRSWLSGTLDTELGGAGMSEHSFPGPDPVPLVFTSLLWHLESRTPEEQMAEIQG